MEKPKIRFKGYQEDWEQRKVTELLKNSSSAMKIGPFGSALKKEYFVEEGIKVYAQENAFTGDFSMGDYFITEDKYKELKSCELYPGDLVISMMGTIGACAIFPKNAEKGIMNSHLLRLQFNNEVIPEYIMYLLRDSVLIRKQIDRLSVGSIMSGLSSSVVKKLVFPIPKLAEQKRIVEYLDSIDRLITLHQRKCEEMKILKKYMLQKMFPQNGQLVPQIRFSGFTEDWEQRKVTELGEIYIGLVTTMTEHYTDNGHLLIRNSDIKDGYFEFGENPIYLDEEFSEQNKSRMHQLGDVITVHTGDIGTSAVIGENEVNSIGFATIVTRPNQEILDSNYFATYLNTDTHKQWAVSMATGDGRSNYNLKDYTKLVVPIPEIEEQKKIAACIVNLNSLITLHQQKCDELRNIKKFMLQNMFI